MERELRRTPSSPRELRDILVTVKSGARMLGWLGAIKWLSGVVRRRRCVKWCRVGQYTPK